MLMLFPPFWPLAILIALPWLASFVILPIPRLKDLLILAIIF
jgi:hypothetical protein